MTSAGFRLVVKRKAISRCRCSGDILVKRNLRLQEQSFESTPIWSHGGIAGRRSPNARQRTPTRTCWRASPQQLPATGRDITIHSGAQQREVRHKASELLSGIGNEHAGQGKLKALLGASVRHLHRRYADATIQSDLATAGFVDIRLERVTEPSRAASAGDAATIVCHGSMLRTVIDAYDPSRLDEVTNTVTATLFSRFGMGPVEGVTQAVLVSAERP